MRMSHDAVFRFWITIYTFSKLLCIVAGSSLKNILTYLFGACLYVRFMYVGIWMSACTVSMD